MSNTIFSCSVWCEVHGPVNIFCTQTSDAAAIASQAAPSAASAAATKASTSSESRASDTAVPTSPSAKGTCASCSLYLPSHLSTPGVAPCLKTSAGKTTYISVRHPSSQDRYKAIRSACIRALSCELVPGRTGPVFFGDPSIGYTIAHIFRLTDPSSSNVNTHDSRRQYALMCTSADEQELLQSWTFVTERFRVLVQKITEGGKLVSEGNSAQVNQRYTPESLNSDRSFLRPKGRAAEKGLAELTGMDDIFVQLHAAFSWMLSIWRMHFEGAHKSDSSEISSGETSPEQIDSSENLKDIGA